MMDLQVVYVRDLADIQDVSTVAMIRVDKADVYGTIGSAAGQGRLAGAKLNGVDTHYIIGGPDTVFVSIPGQIAMEGVRSITLVRESILLDSSGNTLSDSDDPSLSTRSIAGVSEEIEVGSLLSDEVTGTQRVYIDQSLIHVRGKEFNSATFVLVNGQKRDFKAISDNDIIVSVPSGTSVVESLDVIKEASSVSGRSFLSYSLGKSYNAVAGELKLMQQFVKLLLTSRGSNAFNQDVGGDLQNFVGQKVDPNNMQALVAQTTANIILNVGLAFQAGQSGGNMPDNERLASVDVLNVGVDPLDNTSIELSLRLRTFAGTSSMFSLALGTLNELSRAGN